VVSVYAHGFGGGNGLPVPRWLLAYVLGIVIVLAFVVLRFVRPPPRRAADDANATTRSHDLAPVENGIWPRWFVVTRGIGLFLLVATFISGAIGTNDSGANIAPVTVIVLFFLGMQLVSFAFGDIFWWFNPFDTLAAVFFRDDGSRNRQAPSWTAAAFLASFVWFVFAYPEFYPPTPHEVATFLAVYTVAVVACAGVWGRSWVRRGEGFGALFGGLAQLGRRRESGPELAPLLVVYLGGILFDGMSQTMWWIKILGSTRGWDERAINTVGFIWSIAIVGVAYIAATRIIATITHTPASETARRFARVMLAIGLALSVAHYLPAVLIDVQNFYALLSDPLGRGWNVFGTIDYAIDQQVLTTTQMGLLQSVLLGLGCVGAAVIAHDAAFENYRGRAAVRATYPIATLLIVGSVGAIWLLLGS
jgi:hypothetical protein